jgi:hypothetical protein
MVDFTSFCHGPPLCALEIKDVSISLKKQLQVQAVENFDHQKSQKRSNSPGKKKNQKEKRNKS